MRRRFKLASVGTSLLAMLLLAGACTGGSSHPVSRQARSSADAERPGGDGYEGEHEGALELERYEEIKAAQDWFYGQRTAPGRTIHAEARSAALTQALAMESATSAFAVSRARPRWSNLGPRPINAADQRFDDIDTNGSVYQNGFGNVSGRVTALATDPNDANVVYLGAADGGVWQSKDGGTTWKAIGDRLASLAVGAIAVDPADSKTVFVGTGESNTSSDAYYGIGILRSTDGGRHFTNVTGNLLERATVFKILVKGGTVIAATNRGVWRGTGGGTSWTQVLAPGGTTDLYGNFATDVVDVPGTGYVAAIGWRGGDAANGLYQSADDGATWTAVTPAGFPAQANLGRMSLAATPAQPGLMYAVIQDAALFNAGGSPTILNGVYRSLTGPAGPWSLTATSSIFASDPNSALNPAKIGPTYQPGVQAWYNQYVAIDPTDPTDVVVGLEEIYNSHDGGASWQTIGRYWNVCQTNPGPPGCYADPIQHPTTHPDQHAVAFAVSGGEPVLYAGSDGGAYRQVGPAWSNDNWTNLNAGLSISQPYYAEASSGLTALYAGTQDNGNVKYEGSKVWPQIFGGDGGDVAVEPDNPDNTYEEYVYLQMSRSSNGGVSWVNDIGPADSGSSSTARFIAPFDMDPLNKNHLVAVGRHVNESTAGIGTTSSSWTQSYDNGSGHVGTALAVRGSTIYEGWCGPCNPTTLDADAPFARGMATNAGGTWHAVAATGLPNRYITGLAIDPANDQHVYATLSAFSRRWIPRAGEGHVFESTDGGATFTDISSNLPDAPANDVVLYQGRLIVGTDVGVFERDAGGTWAVLGRRLPAVSVLDLSVVPGGSTLVAATHGRGVWTVPLA